MTVRICVGYRLRSVFLIAAAQASAALGTPLSIVDLQKLRSDTILDISTSEKSKAGFVRLINLNPDVNTWFILDVTWPGESTSSKFHIENPEPKNRLIFLDKNYQSGLQIVDKGKKIQCELWTENKESELRQPDIVRKSYAPICEGKLYLRNETEGSETTKEWAADLLRSHMWGGEQITTLVKDYLYKDKFLLTANADEKPTPEGSVPSAKPRSAHFPLPAKMQSKKQVIIETKELGLKLADGKSNQVVAGRWYETSAQKNVYFSANQAGLVDSEAIDIPKYKLQKLDAVEAAALNYLVAYDLENLDLGFALGTKHPSPEWSERTPEKIQKPNPYGPDGIENFYPLRMTGKVSPNMAPRVVSTFTGGFKRGHGAFKWGPLSIVNHASHYGFMENGVVFSLLQPQLATLVIYKDGDVDMKTWSEADNTELKNIKHARQNGVPLIDHDPKTGESFPGAYVSFWTNGNWSGSVDSKQRALRAGACLQEHDNKKFLIYGYFSSVTPNAMAKVFHAYGCKYAFHLDMNALEHTYLALYEKNKSKFNIEHLITGMNVLDRKTKEHVVPRFVGTADNRDFFYVMEKN